MTSPMILSRDLCERIWLQMLVKWLVEAQMLHHFTKPT
jgi:hypothetical protein